jgi:CheY-like chemotaxis protein
MSSKKSTIFVIEDSIDIRELIAYLYQSEGYQVQLAGDGKEALRLLRQSEELPCVILLDIMMPEMDGIQFRAEQEKDPILSKIPVLVMTADSDPDVKAKQLRANGYLKKPVALDALLAVAKKFC